MRLRLKVAPLARRDLSDIADFIAADDPAAALRVIARIERLVNLLRGRPFMGPVVKAPVREGLRKAPSAPYIVFYRVSGDELQIARVLHSSRNIDETLFP